MLLCYGLSRKLSSIPVVAFTLGWALYLVGFVKRMVRPSPSLPRLDNYPAAIAVGAGPVFIITALLHACLGGKVGAAMGSVTAAAAVVFLISQGNSSITSAQTLYQYNSTTMGNSSAEDLSELYLGFTLAGSILCSLAVTVLLSLWGCYSSDPLNADDVTILHSDSYSEERGRGQRVCKSPWFPGYAKKLAIPCLFLAFLGWCVMAGGHYHRINTVSQEGIYYNKRFTFDFGQWGACVLTPIMLIFGLIHAGSRGSASTVMGVVDAIMNGITLTSTGYYMIHDVGDWLKDNCANKCDYTLPRNAAALCEIIGSFVMIFFWGSVLAIWPFYRKMAAPRGHEAGHVLATSYVNRRQRANSQDYINEDDDTQPFNI